jgi:predicted dehydrogenase
MKRVGIVLIGLGPGSQPHLKSLRDLRDRVDLRWAVCRMPDKADRSFLPPAMQVTADLSQALSDPDVDMAIAATPPATHLPIALECLRRGKHILLEKPLEVSFQRAEELAAHAARSSLSCGVVLQHRFRPGSLRLGEILAAGKLGAVQAASVRVPWWRPQEYYDQAGRGRRDDRDHRPTRCRGTQRWGFAGLIAKRRADRRQIRGRHGRGCQRDGFPP